MFLRAVGLGPGSLMWLPILVGSLAACGEPTPARPPNVLLITLDTLRADRLGAYGYEAHDCSPHLDAFAEQSVVFEQAFAASSFTPPSHASIFTGLYPSEHGLTYWNRKLADVPTLAERFSQAGYRTFAVTPLKTLFAIGLGRGFEQALDVPYRQTDDKLFLGDAQAVNAAALAQLDAADDGRPVFAWLHYYDAHRVFGRQGEEWARRYNDSQPVEVGDTEAWYQLEAKAVGGHKAQGDLTPEQVRFLADRYDGGLAYLDQQLGALFDALAARGRLDDTLVVVTADHGEVFDEHPEQWFAHDPHLYDENLHVPLFVRLPGAEQAGRRVPALVSGVDVAPTLLELAGLAGDGLGASGRSLAAFVLGRTGERRDVVFADRMGKDQTGEPGVSDALAASRRDQRRMLRSTTHKLVHHVDQGRFELFAVTDENRDLWSRQPAEAAALVARYEHLLAGLRGADGTVGDQALDPDTVEFLKALGYVGRDERADDGN